MRPDLRLLTRKTSSRAGYDSVTCDARALSNRCPPRPYDMKFLFDLFPILLFFVAFKIWGIYTATAVAIVATLVQIAWVAFRHRKVDPMLWVSLGVVVVFGGATLVLHNDTFIKWKPTALYWLFAGALIVSQVGFGKNLIEAMMGKQIVLPHRVWGQLNLAWAVFFAILGVVNLFVAFNYTTDQWVNFKLFGATGCLGVFIVAQSLWLPRSTARRVCGSRST